MKKMIIMVEKILGNDIRTRARIFGLTNMMNDTEECVLDFSGVTFISRSFADELISLSEAATGRIQIANTNDEIDALLHIVKKGRTLKTKTQPSQENRIYVLNSMRDVENFFKVDSI